MKFLSQLNAACITACLLMSIPAAAYSNGAPKGYTLSPLETYLIESFAQEQIDGFINSGATTLFESPKIYYINPRSFAKSAKANLPLARQKYVGNYSVIRFYVSLVNRNKDRVEFELSKPPFKLELSMAKNANQAMISEVNPGGRHGFYCKVEALTDKSASLSDCLPLRQFAALKSKQIESLIHRYLAGEKVLDANIPTYAMMAYMAVVSARLLPADSVCKRTVEEEISFTDADRRLCNQEVSELWQNAASNPKFDQTMDNVIEEFKRKGVDVTVINQAASALD